MNFIRSFWLIFRENLSLNIKGRMCPSVFNDAAIFVTMSWLVLKYQVLFTKNMLYFKILVFTIFLERYAAVTNLMQTHIKVKNWVNVILRYCCTNFIILRRFLQNEFSIDKKSSLPILVNHVFVNYLSECTPYVLYDDFFFETIGYRVSLSVNPFI